MFGFLAKEVLKAVAVSAGVEILKEKVIPPVADKIKKKFSSDQEEDEKKDEKSSDIYDVEWE